MVVTLSALRTVRFLTPGNIPGTHFCYRLSRPKGHSTIGRVFIHSLVFSLRGRAGRNQSRHVTGMALAPCILGKFLGVVCDCFPPPLDVPTFAARYLYVRNDARDPSSERWNCGRESFR